MGHFICGKNTQTQSNTQDIHIKGYSFNYQVSGVFFCVDHYFSIHREFSTAIIIDCLHLPKYIYKLYKRIFYQEKCYL